MVRTLSIFIASQHFTATDMYTQPGTYTVPFPYWRQMGVPKSTSAKEMAESCLYQVELILAQQTSAKDTAAILLEPVL